MLLCLLPAVWSAAARRHNEKDVKWNKIVRNLASRNNGRMILMNLEHELRALDHVRFNTDGIHSDSIEEQTWMNCAF